MCTVYPTETKCKLSFIFDSYFKKLCLERCKLVYIKRYIDYISEMCFGAVDINNPSDIYAALIRPRMIQIHPSFFFCRVLHTMFSHLRAHAFARSVTVARSSAAQASSSRRQERRWAIVCGSPQSQSTDWASSRKPHLLITVFAQPTP